MRKSRSRTKTYARVNERKFPFVVQIAVPDGGFGCTLDAINAWHFYSKNGQRFGQRQDVGEQQFWRWCFATREVAELFKLRFGGEMVPLVVRQYVKPWPNSAERPGVEKEATSDTGDLAGQSLQRSTSSLCEDFQSKCKPHQANPDSPSDRC